jgi:alginate O-acetyltransferase complex protein AlgJ
MENSEKSLLSRAYSCAFLICAAVCLLSFAAVPESSLTTISTDFRWRNSLIGIYNGIRLAAGDRVFHLAVIGSQGWIFYTGETSVQDFQNTDFLKKRTILSLREGLDQLNSELEEEGRTLLVVIPPNKATVYSRYMPAEIPIIGEVSRLDQFVDGMQSNNGVRLLDLRSTLIAASMAEAVYYKTDTHWNDQGAYYGYVEMLKVLSADYPSLAPHSPGDFKYEHVAHQSRDLAMLMGVPQLREDSWGLTPLFPVRTQVTRIPQSNGGEVSITINENTELPELLIYHDSFYYQLAKFIEPHFGRVVNVPFGSDPDFWTLDLIQKEAPDIVVIEFAERYLDFILSLMDDPD